MQFFQVLPCINLHFLTNNGWDMDYFLLYVRKNYGYNENHSRILPVSSQPFHNTAKKGHRFMKTAAIIAEYNPFHNGHFYQIQKLHDQIDADFVIALMSGDFVQRGEPAVYDKYTRFVLLLAAQKILLPAVLLCWTSWAWWMCSALVANGENFPLCARWQKCFLTSQKFILTCFVLF